MAGKYRAGKQTRTVSPYSTSKKISGHFDLIRVFKGQWRSQEVFLGGKLNIKNYWIKKNSRPNKIFYFMN